MIRKIIPKLSGKILIIGFDYNQLYEIINKNNDITYCDFWNSTTNNEVKGTPSKIINIRKLRKKYKKKKIDYLIVNIEEVEKYLKFFVKDSIFICSKKIYLFNNSNPNVLNFYKRYDITYLNEKPKSNFIEIDVSNAKTNILLDCIYLTLDTITQMLNLISEFLIS